MSESYCALRITLQEPVVLNTDPAGPPPLRCPECPSSAWRNYNAQVRHRCRRCRFPAERGVRGKCRADPHPGRLDQSAVRAHHTDTARSEAITRCSARSGASARTERPTTDEASRISLFSWTHHSTSDKIMRKSAMTALDVISVLWSAASSCSAHAIRKCAERFQFVTTKVNEQSYLPPCSLPFERLRPVNPDRHILMKICA